MMETLILDFIAQAPSVGAVIIIVVVFLRHIRDGDKENRATTSELAAAIRELSKELRERERDSR